MLSEITGREEWRACSRRWALSCRAAWRWLAPALAADDFKIGVLYDYTGPLAGGGSKAAGVGSKIAIDLVNERGGIDGRKIVGIYADAQSKTEVAINETERLLNEQKVDVVMGVFSSAQCVPMAAKIDAAKKIFWATVCVSSAVFKDRNLQYVFRANIHSDQYGDASCTFVNENAKSKFGKEPKDLKIAIIHEDGPYGSGIAGANEMRCKQFGMQIVHKEAYAATSTDLSALVTKLRRAQPDIILHTGYNPDITLFLRQAKEAGLKFQALIGHGAGYSQIDKLYETFKDDVNYLLDVDPAPAQLLDAKTLAPGLGDLTKELEKRYKAAEPTSREMPPHASMGFNHTWVFPQRRAAACAEEIRRRRSRGSSQSCPRYGHPAGRHDPGLRREILPARHADGRAERTVAARRDAVREGRDQGRVADRHQDRRSRHAVPGRARLRALEACPACDVAVAWRKRCLRRHRQRSGIPVRQSGHARASEALLGSLSAA